MKSRKIKRISRSAAVIGALMMLCILLPMRALAVTNTYYYHDCTWTAWQMAYDRLGIQLPRWGFASNWYDFAARDGFAVGQTPAPESIVVWNGHVGYVTQVSGSSIYVLHGGQGDGSDWYAEYWMRANGPSLSGKSFIGYVYLSGVPASQSEQTSPRQTETQKSPAPRQSQHEPSGDLPDSATAEETAELQQSRLEQLAALQAQKNELESSIAELDQEIESLNTELDEKKERSRTRLRSLYMAGTGTFVQWLFSSESYGDFFFRLEQGANLLSRDIAMIDDLKATMSDIRDKQNTLKEQQNALDEIYI